MKNRFKIGDHVYIVECGLYAKEVVIVGIAGGFYQICFTDRQGSLRLKESKLYATKEEAESVWSSHRPQHRRKLHKREKDFILLMLMNGNYAKFRVMIASQES
ncbi:hypothetical protein [Eubacterium sp.]|uniref:hypothetical protein n=1 Tax=Eubacterium sp. TaxID=142586 RepID=UPI003A95536C